MNILKLLRRKRWTDADIEHYERMARLEDKQQAAREALGLKWKCHKANASPRVGKPRPALYLAHTSPIIEHTYGPVATVSVLRRKA